MTQEELLLERVINHPDDDAPRLAYAGYMDEIGDPRGQFIRIGVELGRINGDYSNPNFLPLAENMHAMIEQYGAALAGPVAGLVDRYSFDRGFVELVALPARRFLELARQLYALSPIRHLDLTDVRPVIHELFSSPSLEPLRSLSLQNCKLTDKEIEILAASPFLKQLRWLSLADNLVRMPGAEALASTKNLPGLRYVVFDGNPVNPSQQFGHDQGVIMDFWMPDEGSYLEQKYGRLPWLRADPRKITDLPPSRFAR
jgi:uncharacterized protein (TIGR02996 family)